MIEIYGIPNCDTVRKARAWLDERGLAYAFHDYKKDGADPAKLRDWSAAAGWEALLNRRGTTFCKLAEADRADIDELKALTLMGAHPSLIKRPVLEHDGPVGGGLLVGFDPAQWQAALA